eukprot:4445709-Amphidinium_carterae.1
MEHAHGKQSFDVLAVQEHDVLARWIPGMQKWLRKRGYRLVLHGAERGRNHGTRAGVGIIVPSHIGMAEVSREGLSEGESVLSASCSHGKRRSADGVCLLACTRPMDTVG